MNRRRDCNGCVVVLRVGEGDKLRIQRAVALCKALDPTLRVGDVLVHAMTNLSRSARTMLRRRGVDPESILAARRLESPPDPAPFDGPPVTRGRIYVHQRERRAVKRQ